MKNSPRLHSNVRESIQKGQKAKPLRSQTIFRERFTQPSFGDKMGAGRTSEWGRGKLGQLLKMVLK